MTFINLKRSLGARLFIIAFLTLILLIPSVFIMELISEREQRRDTVTEEISRKWGAEQTLVGPLITVPYTYSYQNGAKVEQTLRYAHFLPEYLHIEGIVTPEIRYRGIYEVIVYNTRLTLSGTFGALDLADFKIPREEFLLEDAFVSVGISDMTGLRDIVEINWNGREYIASPGVETNDVIESGFSFSPDPGPDSRAFNFDFELNLNGSMGLLFSPVGEQTTVQITSDWPNPSFTGHFLPVSREVNTGGFSATWNVLNLNRNFPQHWLGSKQEVTTSTFGVNLLQRVDEYQKTMRTVKYAIMFISLSFLTFFMFELLNRKTIHPFQYLFIGTALLIFYILLLSISEYTSFNVAYFLASVPTILMISLYSRSVLEDGIKSGIISLVLIVLYGYLYILLQLQDYALLVGSIGLFSVLGLVMFLTRNLNWFEVMSGSRE